MVTMILGLQPSGFESRLVKHFLGQPDLSPIEHVWDMMGRQLHLPRNVDDLARQLEQIWQEKPQETIRVVYHSMPRNIVESRKLCPLDKPAV
ncbi:transposable element Tcb1 transposase [Trichonephila clavipes]|nr:transposable element Tcb1 transposase [Trichonephila clavipes]